MPSPSYRNRLTADGSIVQFYAVGADDVLPVEAPAMLMTCTAVSLNFTDETAQVLVEMQGAAVRLPSGPLMRGMDPEDSLSLVLAAAGMDGTDPEQVKTIPSADGRGVTVVHLVLPQGDLDPDGTLAWLDMQDAYEMFGEHDLDCLNAALESIAAESDDHEQELV